MIRATHAPSSIVITQILEQALFLRDVDSLFRYIEYQPLLHSRASSKINQLLHCGRLDYLQFFIKFVWFTEMIRYLASYFFACYLSSTAVQSMSIQICLILNRFSCSVLKWQQLGNKIYLAILKWPSINIFSMVFLTFTSHNVNRNLFLGYCFYCLDWLLLRCISLHPYFFAIFHLPTGRQH